MRLLFTGYVNSPGYQDPQSWLQRIEPYTGILKALATSHEIISIEHINYEGTVRQDGIRYEFLNLGRQFHRRPWKFHVRIKRLKPDVVFINGFNFPLQVLFLKLILPKQAKVIILHRAERPFEGVKKWLQILADRFVYAYLFSSTEFSKAWKKNLNTDKIHQVMQASSIFEHSDKNLARRNLGMNESDRIFLYVGNLNPGKDPLTVVRAFAEFTQNHGNTRLYIIYQSELLLPEIRKIIKEENATEKIKLVGKIEHKLLVNWYNAADFIISGSHYEGSGIAIAEAMSCGCIPILTNITSFRGMTGPGICGFLYGAGNPDDLLQKLLQLKNLDMDKEKQRTLNRFHSELSFGAIAKKINCIIGPFDHANHNSRTQD